MVEGLQKRLAHLTSEAMLWDESNIFELKDILCALQEVAVDWTVHSSAPYSLKEVVDLQALPTAGPHPVIEGKTVLAVDIEGRAIVLEGLEVIDTNRFTTALQVAVA